MKQEPIIIINCKAYTDNPAKIAMNIAQAAKKVMAQRKKQGLAFVQIALAVSATNIFQLTRKKLIPIYAQHADPQPPGAHTGTITIEDLSTNGATGTLINHSEDPTSTNDIKQVILRATSHGLTSVVCAKNDKAAAQYAALQPDYIAMEPPALIGGDISVSTAQPQLITKTIQAVKKVGRVHVLVGAGVKNAADVSIAYKLGARGILVASGVVLVTNPEQVISDLASGFDS